MLKSDEAKNCSLPPSKTQKNSKSSFQKKLNALRRNKVSIQRQMKKDANDPRTEAYYNDPNNVFGDVDVEPFFGLTALPYYRSKNI